MTTKKIAILGCGNMANALFKGQPDDFLQGLDIFTYTPSKTRAEALASELKGQAVELNCLPACDYYFLGCKPQQFPVLADQLSVAPGGIVISIMNGLDSRSLQRMTGAKTVVRTMPNTAALAQASCTLFWNSEDLPLEDKNIILNFFKNVGQVVELKDENQIDAITPISGSGSAYLFEISCFFEKYLQSHQVPADLSKSIIYQIFEGSARLMQASGKSFEQMRSDITSKGGSTEAALDSLRDSHFSKVWEKALESGYKRVIELKS